MSLTFHQVVFNEPVFSYVLSLHQDHHQLGQTEPDVEQGGQTGKGQAEDKESPEECNIRETFEETGLILKSARYCGIVTFVSDKWETEYMHIFHSNSVIIP